MLKFYCPLKQKRIRKSCGTRDRTEARKIMRECRERLLNGEYVATGGAITKSHERALPQAGYAGGNDVAKDVMSFDEAFQQYRAFKKNRHRLQSFQSMCSALEMTMRIFESRRTADGLQPGVTLEECLTLASLEYLQDQLRCGAEGRYDTRLPTSVNSIMGDVMAFSRFCYKHDWIAKIPPIEDLDEEEVSRGRAITGEEFDRLIESTPKVVGETAAPSWNFLLQVLWESGFRIADALNFYWDDETKIHPRWAGRQHSHSTLVIPSTQKNGKFDEIPMLPGLEEILAQVPDSERKGKVINLFPVEFAVPDGRRNASCPRQKDLSDLIADYSNVAIAAALQVSETAVRGWLRKHNLERKGRVRKYGESIPNETIEKLRKRSRRRRASWTSFSKDRVSRIVSAIGQEAGIIVRQPDQDRHIRIKYASAHDLRRSLAERLYNKGMSAETLMVIMRHRDFSTTRKYYQAKKRAESAAIEVHQLLGGNLNPAALVGGLMGGNEKAPQLTAEELLKLKALLNAL